MRLLFLLLLSCPVSAQFTYRQAQDITVEVNGIELLNPWAGGLNSPQINTMHLNGDTLDDIVIFDKTTAQIRTFLRVDGAYQYAPEFESLFPAGLSTFVQLRDYNCDGKKDLFTFGGIGVYVYQQVSVPGKPFGFTKVNFSNYFTGLDSQVLLTKGFIGPINLLPGSNDLPDFTDIDGDGDLDVLNMRFVSPSTAEYHKNFSMEEHGVCNLDSLVRQTSEWGDFIECSCSKIAFGSQSCADIGGRTNHTGGKAMLSLDTDGDGDRDLLFSEESCVTLYHMENLGTTEVAAMNNLTTYPGGGVIIMPTYPAPYLEDVDQDGKKDLLVALNVNARTDPFTDFGSSLWYFRNTGTNEAPNFMFQQTNFLQDEMLEFGDLSSPALTDIDGDGDLDLFAGTYINPKDFRGAIIQFENIGTSNLPRFRWVTDSFANLTFTSLYNMRPQFYDLDLNGSVDLVFTGTTGGNTRLWYLLAPQGGPPEFTGDNLAYLEIPVAFGENAFMTDVDLDGRPDVLLGKNNGALYHYQNTGTGTTHTFSLVDDAFLGWGAGTARQNPDPTVGDLDGDGKEDLILGDQEGTLTVFPDFRSPNPLPEVNLVHDEYSNQYIARNHGGNSSPAVANLLNVTRPSLIVGNRQGGLTLLHNDESAPLSEAPEISLSPNPVSEGASLTLIADRSVTLEIYTVAGTRLGEPQWIPGNQLTDFPIRGISAGLYMARFTSSGGKSTVVRFVVK